MFNIEIEVEEKASCGHGAVMVFKKVRPTNGMPYQYRSFEDAQKMAEMCYGHSPEAKYRIVEVNNHVPQINPKA